MRGRRGPDGRNRDSATTPVTAWLYWPEQHYLLAFSRSAFPPLEEPVASSMQSIDLEGDVSARNADGTGSIRGVRRVHSHYDTDVWIALQPMATAAALMTPVAIKAAMNGIDVRFRFALRTDAR